ncbi:Integrase catalytic domain-containing protein [Aphis craccivora]|uniref:Integrase catalytic domain-containing protein n=1 Tax=Aphis craccivora TaxID=307492 RepID=A0A6G0XDQ3_APHCR|nr:Integrase catalytic domain-containing protein [Aphis craccivora]
MNNQIIGVPSVVSSQIRQEISTEFNLADKHFPIRKHESEFNEYLRHYVVKELNNWDEYLPYAFFVYNSTEHTSTGYQPYS